LTKESDDFGHFPRCTEIEYFDAISMNMRPSQSSATEASKSGGMPSFGAAERGGHRIAAKGDGVVARHRLLIARRQFVRDKGDVDIALTDEEGFHELPAIP